MTDETAEFRVGNIVRQDSDDGSMGTAEIVAVAMGKAWCFYAKADCHRVHSLERLQTLCSNYSVGRGADGLMGWWPKESPEPAADVRDATPAEEAIMDRIDAGYGTKLDARMLCGLVRR